MAGGRAATWGAGVSLGAGSDAAGGAGVAAGVAADGAAGGLGMTSKPLAWEASA